MIRSEKRPGHSRFPAGQKHLATVVKTTDRMPPRKLQQIQTNEKDEEENEGQGTIEEKEEKREEDKIGKETRALQVPCGSERYGYSGENNNQNASPETTADIDQ